MNVKKWLKIAVCSSPLNIYHGTDNIIKQSFISSSSPVRNNIFYEIETSSTGLYNTGLGAQVYRRGQVPVLAKTFKNDGIFGFGSPYLPPFFEKVWMRPLATLKKNYRSKISKFQNLKKIQNSQEISKLSKNSKFSKTKFKKFKIFKNKIQNDKIFKKFS